MPSKQESTTDITDPRWSGLFCLGKVAEEMGRGLLGDLL